MELEDIVNEEMLTTEDVNNMLEHTDKGRTKQTIRNCVTVLQKDPVLKKAIKRNELSGRMDIVKEVPWERRNNSPTVTDTDENNLKMYLEENYELTSERVIKAGVDIVSNENKYHPIRDYLESLVWDGIPRIENMLPHFLGAEKAWAEAMVLYRQGNVFLGFTKEIEEEAKRLQKEFMPEDTNAGRYQCRNHTGIS